MRLKQIAPLLRGEVSIYKIRGYEEETIYTGDASRLRRMPDRMGNKEVVSIHADNYMRGITFVNVKSGRMSHNSKV